MDGQYVRWGVTHNAATDVLYNICLTNWHHGHWSIGGEPVRFVVSAGIVADVVGTTEQEWHSVESSDTGTGPS